jgi:hypothetical protein
MSAFLHLTSYVVGRSLPGVVLSAFAAAIIWRRRRHAGMARPDSWRLWTFAPLLLPMVCIVAGAAFIGSAPAVLPAVMLLAVLSQFVVGAAWMANAGGWRWFVAAVWSGQTWVLGVAWFAATLRMTG